MILRSTADGSGCAAPLLRLIRRCLLVSLGPLRFNIEYLMAVLRSPQPSSYITLPTLSTMQTLSHLYQVPTSSALGDAQLFSLASMATDVSTSSRPLPKPNSPRFPGAVLARCSGRRPSVLLASRPRQWRPERPQEESAWHERHVTSVDFVTHASFVPP